MKRAKGIYTTLVTALFLIYGGNDESDGFSFLYDADYVPLPPAKFI